MGPDPPLSAAAAPNVPIDIDSLHDRLLPQSLHPNPHTPPTPSQTTSPSLTDHVTSTLRQRTATLRTLKVRAEFEYTLLLVLAIHVVYMYYLDHTLLVFLIRASQLIRLLYFPFENQANQRGTAVLLLLSNLPVLAIHKMIFMSSQRKHFGQMLFINFIGPEPKSLAKTLYIDSPLPSP
ncbi:hypothetical protein BWQ96_00619 [Gracilariopsis chorda]|uniref:DUF1746 domain-containing protein n=1 Tax=Gracilariopsis chorda TaxID=448386 RepID=A0A2V3J579_9FLOR|nr:hypothetical protein BWQ96_00619 [Gracilariopsis chorda]|eukprot:PXF49549.1 hypothetical protein BWQ96_00619 [Gracilariopsis chorda]